MWFGFVAVFGGNEMVWMWVSWLGGVGVRGLMGGCLLCSFTYFALNSYFWGFFKMLTAIISLFVYFVGFHYDFCIFYSRKRKWKTFFPLAPMYHNDISSLVIKPGLSFFLFHTFFSKCLETSSLPYFLSSLF